MTSRIDQRISRAESRMKQARCVKWRHAWESAFKSAVSARNAINAVTVVRK